MSASIKSFSSWMRALRWPAFSARRELQAYLRRRLDTFITLVYTFCGNRGPSIMTMSSALAEIDEYNRLGQSGRVRKWGNARALRAGVERSGRRGRGSAASVARIAAERVANVIEKR